MAAESAEVNRMIQKLTKILGTGGVTKGATPLQVIVHPKTTGEVSDILKMAESEDIPIFPAREAPWVKLEPNTPGAIMMDTTKMNGIFEIDEENLAVTVGPGVLWKDLYKAMIKRKYTIGAYPDSNTPTVGEWIDSNGTGIGSYRHGFAGDQIRTLEIVLPNGKIIDTGFKKVLPNSSGYNLNGLFAGADGTLGVITKVTLKMFPKPEGLLPLYYVFKGPEDMRKALSELTKQKVTPLNVSFFHGNHIHTLRNLGKNIPEIAGIIVNVTLAGLKAVVDHNKNIVDQLMQNHGAQKVEGIIAEAIWKERFFDVGSKGKNIKPLYAEILVPLSSLEGVINETMDILAQIKVKGALMGIVSDRSTVSFTPYLLGEGKTPEMSKVHTLFIKKMGELSLRHYGRPVGSALYLVSGVRRVYGEGVNTILDIKSAIDPHDIMNPQVFK